MFESIKQNFVPNNEHKQIQDERKFATSMAREQQAMEAALTEDRQFMEIQESRNDLLRWQQDLNEDVSGFIHELRREVMVDGQWQRKTVFKGYNKQNQEVYEEVPPIMNELGIDKIRTLLNGITSRNIFNSNYSDDRVFANLRRIIMNLIYDIRDNYQLYNLKFEDCTWLVDKVKTIAEASFWRCWNNGERKYQTTIYKNIEAKNESVQQQEKKKTIFGGLVNG